MKQKKWLNDEIESKKNFNKICKKKIKNKKIRTKIKNKTYEKL